MPAGPVTVGGYAQPGNGRRIERVDVSTDGGTTWNQAELDLPYGPWAWCRWTHTLCARPGPLSLVIRAFDDTATTQPETPAAVWNPKGYLNNSWPRMTLHVT